MSAPPPPPPPPPGHVQSVHVVETNTSNSIITILNIINAITHWLLGAVVIGAFFFANIVPKAGIFSTLRQHIYLCVTGYIILMSLAITSINPYSGFLKTLDQNKKRTIHFVLQVIGSVLAIAGSILSITKFKNFNSAHGILGLIAMILTFLSLIGGLVNVFAQKLNKFPVLIKSCHACLGSVTLIVAFLSLIFGFSSDIFRNSIEETNSNMCIAFTVFALVGVIISPCITLFSRLFK